MKKRRGYLFAFSTFAIILALLLPVGSPTSYGQEQQDSVVAAAASTSSLPGAALAWGDNAYGQLGNGTNTNSNMPTPVSGLTGITDVAAGYSHSLALKPDGTVRAWGRNNYGQLGNGTSANSAVAVQVSGLGSVAAIAAGGNHGLALKSDGTVWAWGRNDKGQLGNGTFNNSSTPVQVSGLSGVTAIEGGYSFSLALKSDGTVWAWGENARGQLGNGSTANSATPVRVSNLSGVTRIASDGYGYHSLALKSDGTVWAWGANAYGQLGNGPGGSGVFSSTPVQISSFAGSRGIACGFSHSMALKSDGTVWALGENNVGQLGDGTTASTTTAVQVRNLSGVTAIAGGIRQSLAVDGGNTVYAWGSNSHGQLGNGSGGAFSATPVSLNGIHQPPGGIACGNGYNLAFGGDAEVTLSGGEQQDYDAVVGQSSQIIAAVRNEGTADAIAVTFSGDIEGVNAVINGVSYSYCDADGNCGPLQPASCNITSFSFACNLGNLAPGGILEARITYTPGSEGLLDFDSIVEASNDPASDTIDHFEIDAAVTRLSSLTLNPATVTGGSNSVATLTLGAASPNPNGYAASLQSSNPAVATVPSSLTVSGSSRQFNVTTNPVTQPTTVEILADDGYGQVRAFLTVTPGSAVGLDSLTLSPSTVAGGCKTSTGRVTLTDRAPTGGVVVSLANTNPAATVPSSVTVPAGSSSKTFTITTATVTSVQTGTVTASYRGVNKSAALEVRPVGVQSLALSPNPVTGGNTVTGTVTLECPAAPGDIVVTLSSGNRSVARPTVGSITIPAGTTSKSFTITTSRVTTASFAYIYARANDTVRRVRLTVNP